MKLHFCFKTVLCGVLAGLLIGLVLTAFWRGSIAPPASQRSDAKDSAPATAGMTGSRTDLFQQLLRPYLTKLKEVGSLPPSDIFKFEGIIASWLRADTPSCAEFLTSAGMAVLLQSGSESLLTSEAVDALSVLEEAGRLPTPELRETFLRTAIAQLAEKNPAEALRATHSLPRWLVKSMQKRVAEIWVKKDVRGALQTYFDDQAIDQREVFTHAMRAAAKENLEQAFDVVSSWPPSAFQRFYSKDSVISALFAPLDKKEPKLVWACLQKLPESSLARQKCTTKLALMEMERGDAALPKVVNLKNAYQIIEVAGQAASKNKSFAEIQDVLDQIPGINVRTKAYRSITTYLAAKAPEQTVKWAVTIADPPTRAAAFAVSFKGWISTAPEKAIAYALVDRNHDATTRRQLDLEILDWVYSEVPGIDKSLLAKGFRQLNPVQQAQVKKQIASTFDTVAANKLLKLFQ